MTSEDFAIASSIVSLFIAITTSVSNHYLLRLNVQFLDLYIKANEALIRQRNELNNPKEIDEILIDTDQQDK